MSKAHDPHWRYIAVKFTGTAPSRSGLQNAIKGRFRKSGWPEEELPQLTRYKWPHAIIKFPHTRAIEGREVLPNMDWAIEGGEKLVFTTEPLRTSGTIKTLTDNLKILQVRGQKEPKPRHNH
jgi:RNase P/RNase MRP subunit POP5